MARELGLNPRKFGSLGDTKASPWKAPLAEFIEHCYYKAHKRHSPDVVRSLEQVIKDTEDKKARRRERKAQRPQHVATGAPEHAPQSGTANEA
jgi:GTPase SAR1 family protein